jgi:hypothetical protein
MNFVINRLLVVLAFVVLSAQTSAAQSSNAATKAKEHQVRAALLYNLARFSVWPESRFDKQQSNFNICIDKDEPIKGALQTLSNKPVNGRPLNVSILPKDSGSLSFCHVVYISEGSVNSTQLEEYTRLGILSIGSGGKFIQSGGGMSIERIGKKMGFSISKTTMERAKITPSSKILKLATEVQ